MAIVKNVIGDSVTVIQQGPYLNQVGTIEDVRFDSQGQPIFTIRMSDNTLLILPRFDQRYNPNITY